jgi:hypothetical protein
MIDQTCVHGVHTRERCARCEADALLLRAARQLRRWHDKYGEHRPEWLPPPGEVELQEAIAAFLSDGRSLRY